MSRVTAAASLPALLLAASLVAGVPWSARPEAAETPPAYRVAYLGRGSPVAINNSGVVAGARLVEGKYQPLVSTGGSAWSPLPVPPGSASVFPTALNDRGVIVGVAYTPGWVARAVRWTPGEGGYAVEVLPRLPGDGSSYATDIDNLGRIVGARGALGYAPAMTTGWLYSDTLGLVDLYAEHGWPIVPRAINTAGQVIGGVERLDLGTGKVANIGAGPANHQPVAGVDINERGQVAGSAPLHSVSLHIVSVLRYEAAAGWRIIAGGSRYTAVSSLNNRGDLGYTERGAGLYLEGLGSFALHRLLDPASRQAGWVVTGGAVKINDARVVVTLGRNQRTGQAGAVLLTPAAVPGAARPL
jgi:hypothetical protein